MASSVSPENNEPEHPEHQPNDQNDKPHPAVARQPSLLSLTLDEIQNTVCEPGKTFGSMNMDEFLTNIWTAEEGTAMATTAAAAPPPPPPLLRQNSSVSLPSALCRKTVDEVWSEIQHHRSHPLPHQDQHQNIAPQSVPRQPTLGEMTLEDFLIKAGVVRDGGGAAVPCSIQQLDQVQAPYGAMIGATNAYVEQPHNSFHPRAMAGNGHHHPHHPMIGSPSSPASSDGFSGAAGMKRGPDGGSDRVMERRQRRMIKNRESAARSRARKQAYTVELETELNQLKEENARLQEEQRRSAARRRQMAVEAMAEKAAQAMSGKRGFKALRHCNSCNW